MTTFEKNVLQKDFVSSKRQSRRHHGFARQRRYQDLFGRQDMSDADILRAEDELLALVLRPEFDATLASLFDMRLQQLVMGLDGIKQPALRQKFHDTACQVLNRLKPKSEKRRAEGELKKEENIRYPKHRAPAFILLGG